MSLTTGLAFWAAIGPLAGIVLGHVLSRTWQFRQWKLENRRQEYREVLQALTTAYLQMQRFKVGEKGTANAKDQIEVEGLSEHSYRIEQAKMESFRVLQDRIVIADELEWVDALRTWADAFHNFEIDGNDRLFSVRFKKLRETLVSMARRKTGYTLPFHRRLRRWAEWKLYRWKNRKSRQA